MGNNVNIAIKEMEGKGVEWIKLAENSVHWRSVSSAITKLRTP